MLGFSSIGEAAICESPKTYPDALLEVAQGLISAGQHAIAVVVVHMACEIAVERILSHELRSHIKPDLQSAIEDFFPGYNLSNQRMGALYAALTGRPIQQEGFWSAFCDSA